VTEPTTEAGRALWTEIQDSIAAGGGLHVTTTDILAIEAEARARAGLDACDFIEIARRRERIAALIHELYERGYSLQPMRAAPDPAPPLDVLQSAYSMALIQIEADGRTIERLKRALTVAHHRPHDNLGPPDPDYGFPTCSGCEAILTEPDAALASEDRP
jgi:hypothetical protein